jgi:hypothetical protein
MGQCQSEILHMADDPHINIQFDRCDTNIEFPSEGTTVSATVEALGGKRYRLRSAALLVESASFMDVIEADEAADGNLTFQRVVERSGWQVFDFMVSREFVASGKLEPILARAVDLGGHWERVFGGMLFICVPPGIAWNPTAELTG